MITGHRRKATRRNASNAGTCANGGFVVYAKKPIRAVRATPLPLSPRRHLRIRAPPMLPKACPYWQGLLRVTFGAMRLENSAGMRVGAGKRTLRRCYPTKIAQQAGE